MDKEIWRCRTQFMKRVQLFSHSNFSHSLHFLSRCKTCQIKYPKVENKPLKKNPIYYSLNNQPPLSNPDRWSLPTADLLDYVIHMVDAL